MGEDADIGEDLDSALRSLQNLTAKVRHCPCLAAKGVLTLLSQCSTHAVLARALFTGNNKTTHAFHAQQDQFGVSNYIMNCLSIISLQLTLYRTCNQPQGLAKSTSTFTLMQPEHSFLHSIAWSYHVSLTHEWMNAARPVASSSISRAPDWTGHSAA